jgi:type IV secretion system protein VirD4
MQKLLNAIEQVNLLQIIAFSIIVILIKIILNLTFRYGRKSKPIKELYGSARFANINEIEKRGLLNNEQGVYIGAIEHIIKKYYIFSHTVICYLKSIDDSHCLVLAPTRSGKGVCLVVPTLLTWSESAIIYDIKRELWHLTSKYRKTISKCYLFDTASNESAFFNPLLEVRIGTDKQVADAQNIAIILVDPQGDGLKEFWDKTSYDLITGVILYLLHNDPLAKLSDILSFFVTQINNHTVMQQMATFECNDKVAKKIINEIGISMVNTPEKTLGSIIANATAFLTVFRDPEIQRVTSKSDFKISDIMNAQNPVSLYLASDPSNMDRIRPLIRVILNQILRKLTETMNFKDGKAISPHKHKLLLMLDEFTSLGNLEIIQTSLAFMAAYGIRSYFIAQDISQIHKAYTKNESITANCSVQIAFTPNNLDTANYLSESLGNKTVYKNHTSSSGKAGASINDSYSSHVDEVQRPLMTAEEIKSMQTIRFDKNKKLIDTGNMLIFVNGIKPIMGKQAPYFVNSTMMSRVM